MVDGADAVFVLECLGVDLSVVEHAPHAHSVFLGDAENRSVVVAFGSFHDAGLHPACDVVFDEVDLVLAEAELLSEGRFFVADQDLVFECVAVTEIQGVGAECSFTGIQQF